MPNIVKTKFELEEERKYLNWLDKHADAFCFLGEFHEYNTQTGSHIRVFLDEGKAYQDFGFKTPCLFYKNGYEEHDECYFIPITISDNPTTLYEVHSYVARRDIHRLKRFITANKDILLEIANQDRNPDATLIWNDDEWCQPGRKFVFTESVGLEKSVYQSQEPPFIKVHNLKFGYVLLTSTDDGKVNIAQESDDGEYIPILVDWYDAIWDIYKNRTGSLVTCLRNEDCVYMYNFNTDTLTKIKE